MAATAADSPRFAELFEASPLALGLAMLDADLHARRLDRPTRLAAVSAALADGAATASNLQERFPGCAPAELALALAVPIETTDDDPLVGSIWRFAEYRPRPPRIVLYRRGLAPLEDRLDGTMAIRLLGRATPRDVFIAHELYHHAEAIRSETPIARRYRPTLFRIGNWHWRTGIAALAEIAAGAFAQSLLDLPCHPKALDFVAMDAMTTMTGLASASARSERKL
jgi:hypothetical protein